MTPRRRPSTGDIWLYKSVNGDRHHYLILEFAVSQEKDKDFYPYITTLLRLKDGVVYGHYTWPADSKDWRFIS